MKFPQVELILFSYYTIVTLVNVIEKMWLAKVLGMIPLKQVPTCWRHTEGVKMNLQSRGSPSPLLLVLLWATVVEDTSSKNATL